MSRRNSISPDKPRWTPVVCPAPTFDSAEEARAMHRAVTDHPRLEGEPLVEWMERINREAGGVAISPPVPDAPPVEDRRLPREPGG